MRATNLALLGALLLALASAFAGSPAAAAKFDLTPYLGPRPVAGDYRLYELSDGGLRLIEVLEVFLWRKGYGVVTETSETGLEPTLIETFVVPGKKTLLGDSYSAGLYIDAKKPKATFKNRVKPGKVNKFSVKARAFLDGAYVGRAKWKGVWVFSGLAPLDTPADSWPDTAIVDSVLGLIVKDRLFGDVIEGISETAIWYAPGLGGVASQQRTTFYLNGALVEDTGWVESWLVEGQIGGVPYAPFP